MDSDSLRNVQLLLKLLHNSHGSVLGLNNRHSAKLSTRTGHKASWQVSRVDLEPAERQSVTQKLSDGHKLWARRMTAWSGDDPGNDRGSTSGWSGKWQHDQGINEEMIQGMTASPGDEAKKGHRSPSTIVELAKVKAADC